MNDTCCLLLCEISPLFDCVEKIATRDKLHHDVVVARIFHQLEDSSDVWVNRLFQNLQLVLVKLLVNLDLEAFLGDDFDGARDARHFVGAKFDASKCTSAQLLGNLVVICKILNGLESLLGLE